MASPSFNPVTPLLDEGMKFLGEPERVHMRKMDEQLHAHDCYWNVTATSGYRILCNVYIQVQSNRHATDCMPIHCSTLPYALRMYDKKSFLSEKISGHY